MYLRSLMFLALFTSSVSPLLSNHNHNFIRFTCFRCMAGAGQCVAARFLQNVSDPWSVGAARSFYLCGAGRPSTWLVPCLSPFLYSSYRVDSTRPVARFYSLLHYSIAAAIRSSSPLFFPWIGTDPSSKICSPAGQQQEWSPAR